VRAYLDSSALVKLVIDEPESESLRSRLGALTSLVSSELAVVEVMRRARPHGADSELVANRMLEALQLRPIDAVVITLAVAVEPEGLRALDAIHLATALTMVEDLDLLISYDQRLNEAASAAGLRVESPA
jgi:predicted nucleic acid-binding protein